MQPPPGMPQLATPMTEHWPFAPHEFWSQMHPLLGSQTVLAPQTGPLAQAHCPLTQALPAGVQSKQAPPPVPHFMAEVLLTQLPFFSQQPAAQDLAVH